MVVAVGGRQLKAQITDSSCFPGSWTDMRHSVHVPQPSTVPDARS